MTEKQRNLCHGIIHSFSAAAAGVGAGMAQLPASDTVIISGLQVSMIIALGEVFGLEISESSAKGAIGSGVAATAGRTVSQILVGWIPGIGNAINAATAASITEALGWFFADKFAAQQMLLD